MLSKKLTKVSRDLSANWNFQLRELVDLQLLAGSLLALLGLLFSLRSFAQSAPVIKADGSSTVFPITEAMAEEFQSAKKNQVKMTVGISGTGGGFKKFCRGETDVQNASRPIQESELKACQLAGIKFYEIPVGFDATVIVVNTRNTWVNEISVDQLRKMWSPEAQGKIRKWKDVDSRWPDHELKLFGAGSDSGTFDYFTEAIVGKAKASRGDYSASEDDNTLVTGVANDLNALGYMPLAYYEENKNRLKLLGLVGGDKSPRKNEAVYPTRENVEKSVYFPLSRPIFIYVNEKSFAARPELREFVEFYLNRAEQILPQIKYVPLPKELYALSLQSLRNKKVGTVFGGHSEIGLSIAELLKKERKL